MKKLPMVLFFLVFLISACGASVTNANPSGGVEISAPFANAAAAGQNSAAFMSIKNTGIETDTLLKASCDDAMMVQVMESKMEGDVVSMDKVPDIELPAGATVELKPGGYHIMLMNLKQDVVEGSTLMVTLEFAIAGKITVEVPVIAIGSVP